MINERVFFDVGNKKKKKNEQAKIKTFVQQERLIEI